MSSRRGLRSLARPALLFLALAAGAPAAGAPVSLTQAQFNAQIVGLTEVLENFEGFAISDYLSPFGIANGSFTSLTPRVEDSPELCGSMTQCLLDPGATAGIRAFAALPAGARLWGVNLSVGNDSDAFEVTVTGAVAILEVMVSGSGFLGFADDQGLVSIAFQNLGTDFGDGNFGVDNYSFDNVRTGAAAIPEPGGLALLGIALVAVWAGRRRPPR